MLEGLGTAYLGERGYLYECQHQGPDL